MVIGCHGGSSVIPALWEQTWWMSLCLLLLIACSGSNPGDCPLESLRPERGASEIAAELSAGGNLSQALHELSDLQREQPSDVLPLRALHQGLLASAQNSTAGHFAAARSAAEANFDAVLQLISLAARKVQIREIQDLRYAYQQLVLPQLAAKLAQVVVLDHPSLPKKFRAEILLENRQLMEAEEAYRTLMHAEPMNPHFFAQWTRTHSELQAELGRAEVVHALRANGASSDHWALQKPSLFQKVERQSASQLSYNEFYKDFEQARQPVILTESDLYKGWNWEFVRQLCGEVNVVLQVLVQSEESVTWNGMRALPDRVRLADWIRHVQEGLATGDDGVVFDFGLPSQKHGCPKLLETFMLSRFFANDIFKRLPPSNRNLDPFPNSPALFVQPAHSKSALHVDAYDSHFMQILLEGRKRWTFYAIEPERQKLLLAKKLTFQMKEGGPGGSREAKWSEVMGSDGTNDTNLLLNAAQAHRVEVIVEQGELLFVPGGIPHQVTNLAPCLAISLNYVDLSNFEDTIERLMWLANYTSDDDYRRSLMDLRNNLPAHKQEPLDMLWGDMSSQ